MWRAIHEQKSTTGLQAHRTVVRETTRVSPQFDVVSVPFRQWAFLSNWCFTSLGSLCRLNRSVCVCVLKKVGGRHKLKQQVGLIELYLLIRLLSECSGYGIMFRAGVPVSPRSVAALPWVPWLQLHAVVVVVVVAVAAAVADRAEVLRRMRLR